jgi:opacity protein-like surface antigen
MKKTAIILSTIGLLASLTYAADIAGQWRGEFDSQIGQQKYVFTFKTDGDKLTGKASSEVGDQKREADLKEGTITNDTIRFVETLNFNDNDIRIQYTGKVGTNEIAFKREVGDGIATEEFKATRVESTAAPTNSLPATSTNKTSN